MIVDLVQARTTDGVRLDGALRTTEANDTQPSSPVGIELAICVHGTGANFYGSSLWDPLAKRLLAQGTNVLVVNTRGHDLMSTASTVGGRVHGGAAYEIIDDCRFDLAAWCKFAGERGYGRVALLGHSLGALKSIYAVGQDEPPAVACVVAISAPHLSYQRFAASRAAESFLNSYEEARKLVDNGLGGELITITFPIPYVITACGYLDKYGPEQRYDIYRWIRRVACPVLAVYGGAEIRQNVAFEGVPDRLEAIAAEHQPRLQVEVIADADHFYAAARPELAARVCRWLGRIEHTSA